MSIRKGPFPSPGRLCRNVPNPSFRTSAALRGEIRNPVKVQYNQILSGSRLASAAAGLGRDDELRNILWCEEIIVFPDGH